jgi:mRNA-degrading endonuclease RelE of RelBE toxin-antitoxin system
MELNSVKLLEEALQDLERLDRSIQLIALKKLKQLDKNHLLGKPLGKVGSRDLTGYYKIYFADRKYRIVYRIISGDITINGIQEVAVNSKLGETEIAKVYGIGKRNNFEVYNEVYKRSMKK